MIEIASSDDKSTVFVRSFDCGNNFGAALPSQIKHITPAPCWYAENIRECFCRYLKFIHTNFIRSGNTDHSVDNVQYGVFTNKSHSVSPKFEFAPHVGHLGEIARCDKRTNEQVDER